MLSRYEYHGGVWIDVEQPSEEELRDVAKELSLSEQIQIELLTPNPIPLVASEGNATLLVLHFPAPGPEESDVHDEEIDFVVGSSFILTVRYDAVAPLDQLRKILETRTIVSPDDLITTEILLELIFGHLYAAVRDHTAHTSGRISRIEHDMFNGLERTTVRRISGASREFLHVEASLANQIDPLNRFFKTLEARAFSGSHFAEGAERILDERTHLARLVTTYRAIASDLRETNIALLESRQNSIMKTLTVITFIVMPLELIAILFTMHEPGTPFENNPNAFWIILAILLVVGGVVTAFAARKRWLI